MSVLTLTQAQAALDAWMAANEAVSRSQSYSFGTRTLTRADSQEIRTNIQFWSGQVSLLASKSQGIRQPRVSLATWSY